MTENNANANVQGRRNAASKPVTETDEFKAALEAMRAELVATQAAELEKRLAEELAKRPVVEATGYMSYATKALPQKAAMFVKWIEREFKSIYPEGLSDRDARLVMISIRTYRNFQQEVNKK